MRTIAGLVASLLLGLPLLAAGAEKRPGTPAAAVEFLLGGDQWQPGSRYRSGDNWLALVCGEGRCRFEPARLTVRREQWQGHYDDQPTAGQKLLFRRGTAGPGEALAWFRRDPALPWLQVGPVETYWATGFPRKSPATQGTLEQVVDLPRGEQALLVPLLDQEAGRFLLQLRAAGKRQLLDEVGQCSRMVSPAYLVWAGDLDRDGRPDYLIDFADEVGEARLYLARAAAADEIVGVSAVYLPPPFGGECDGDGWLAR